MSTIELGTEQIAQSYLSAWDARDPEQIIKLHSADTRFELHTGGGPVTGPEAVKATFAGMFAMFPGFSFETHRLLLGMDHWVLDWTLVDHGVRLHCLDVVELDGDGLVSAKD